MGQQKKIVHLLVSQKQDLLKIGPWTELHHSNLKVRRLKGFHPNRVKTGKKNIWSNKYLFYKDLEGKRGLSKT